MAIRLPRIFQQYQITRERDTAAHVKEYWTGEVKTVMHFYGQ
jgi:hypothetical protein